MSLSLRRPIGFLLAPGLEDLDLAGPWEMLNVWHEHGDGPPCITVAETDAPVRLRYGLRCLPDRAFEDAPPLSLLVVPGGDGSREAASSDAVRSFVRRQSEGADLVASVCTGVRILRAAGLLDGKQVTTHASAFDEVRAWPEVELVEGERVVRDGTVWTSAGVTAGIDLALAIISAASGPQTAEKVRQFTEWD
jgi:transcriptional regulator GlxA family with amidase domain